MPEAILSARSKKPFTQLELLGKIDKLLVGLNRPSLEYLSARIVDVASQEELPEVK